MGLIFELETSVILVNLSKIHLLRQTLHSNKFCVE